MKRPNVLIIDDEPALQQAMKIALKNEGYDLHLADNGQKGLEIFHAVHPELIFLDLRMPVMDGYEFLKSIDVTADSPFAVIIITGHGDDAEIEQCYKLGIDFFLKKPLSLMETCGLARRCLEVKKLRSEREKLINSLQQAQDTIRQLKDFLILCASCKRVKDKDNQWYKLDIYIKTHTDTNFTHSVCPECTRKIKADNEDTMKILQQNLAKIQGILDKNPKK